MGVIFRQIARLVRAAEKAYAKKWRFFALVVLVFGLSVWTLARLDLLPEAPKPEPTVTLSAKASPLVAAVAGDPAIASLHAEVPVRIEAPAIGLSASIANPETTSIEALDRFLLSGAVRYPTSAKLGENGNVVLFGHSSYLPIVNNQAFKTFNGIQKLTAGDTVTVYSVDAAYTYAVRTVEQESATSGAIPLSVQGKVLTLSTCDSFGEKTDRFVVTADFVGSHPLTTS